MLFIESNLYIYDILQRNKIKVYEKLHIDMEMIIAALIVWNYACLHTSYLKKN